MTAPLWDSGLQPERTALAWRRVGISLLVVGLALPKVAYPRIGVWCLPATVLALACAGLLLALGHRRYQGTQRTLTTTDALASGGRLPLTLAVVTGIVGLTGLATVW